MQAEMVTPRVGYGQRKEGQRLERHSRISRRTFIKKTGFLALPAVTPLVPSARSISVSAGKVRLTIETDGPARLEVRGPQDQMYQPEGALMDRKAFRDTKKDQHYLGHFTSTGTAVLDLPAGRYTLIVEKGLEFQ